MDKETKHGAEEPAQATVENNRLPEDCKLQDEELDEVNGVYSES